jgi:hypothetical protein
LLDKFAWYLSGGIDPELTSVVEAYFQSTRRNAMSDTTPVPGTLADYEDRMSRRRELDRNIGFARGGQYDPPRPSMDAMYAAMNAPLGTAPGSIHDRRPAPADLPWVNFKKHNGWTWKKRMAVPSGRIMLPEQRGDGPGGMYRVEYRKAKMVSRQEFEANGDVSVTLEYWYTEV